MRFSTGVGIGIGVGVIGLAMIDSISTTWEAKDREAAYLRALTEETTAKAQGGVFELGRFTVDTISLRSQFDAANIRKAREARDTMLENTGLDNPGRTDAKRAALASCALAAANNLFDGTMRVDFADGKYQIANSACLIALQARITDDDPERRLIQLVVPENVPASDD